VPGATYFIGAVALAGRQRSVGYHLAGWRVTVCIDRSLLHLAGDGSCYARCPTR
jgi:hypothetical protein